MLRKLFFCVSNMELLSHALVRLTPLSPALAPDDYVTRRLVFGKAPGRNNAVEPHLTSFRLQIASRFSSSTRLLR